MVVNFLAVSSIVAVNNLADEVKIFPKVVAAIAFVVLISAAVADVVGIFDIDNEAAAFVIVDVIDIVCVVGMLGEAEGDGVFEDVGIVDVGIFNVVDIVDVGILDVAGIVDDIAIVDVAGLVDVVGIVNIVEGVFDDFAVANDDNLFWPGVY